MTTICILCTDSHLAGWGVAVYNGGGNEPLPEKRWAHRQKFDDMKLRHSSLEKRVNKGSEGRGKSRVLARRDVWPNDTLSIENFHL